MPYLTCTSCGLRTYAVSEGTCPSCGTGLRRTGPAGGSAPARPGSRGPGARASSRWPAASSTPTPRCCRRSAPATSTCAGARGRTATSALAVPLRDTVCERLLDGRIGSVVADATLEPSLNELEGVRNGTIRAYIGVPFETDRTRGPTCSAAWRARRGRTSGRPTSASCRASPRACDRCSSPLEAAPGLAAAAARRLRRVAAAASGGRARRQRRGRRAPAGDRLLRRAALRHRAARGRAAACSSSSRAGRSASSAAARRSTRRSWTSATASGRRRAGPAVDGVRARLRHQRPLLRLLHRRRRQPARRRVQARSRRRGRPGLRAPADADARQPSPTTTAACCCSAPTGMLYIGIGDGGGGGDQHGARGNGQSAGHAARARSCGSTRARAAARPYSIPRRQPVRRPLRRARRDLQLRPAQPVALLVRPLDGRPDDRRRRPERGRGDLLRARAARAAGRTSAGARSRATTASRRASARPGTIKPVITERHSDGNCSITGGVVIRDPDAAGLARALRVRRLLPRRDPDRGALDRRARKRDRPQARGRAALLVRRGRPRARLRDVAGRAGLPSRAAMITRDPGAQPEPADADRDEHLGRRRRGSSTRGRRSTSHVDAVAAAVAARGGAGGIALTHAHADHSEAIGRCRRGSAACRWAARHARRRRHLRPVRRALHPRPRRRPPRVRRRPAPRSPATPCSARAACSSAGACASTSTGCGGCARWTWSASAPVTATRSPTRRPSSTSTSPTAPSASGSCWRRWRRARATEDELLDAAWADAPANVRPFAAISLRAHLEKLREEGLAACAGVRRSRPSSERGGQRRGVPERRRCRRSCAACRRRRGRSSSARSGRSRPARARRRC